VYASSSEVKVMPTFGTSSVARVWSLTYTKAIYSLSITAIGIILHSKLPMNYFIIEIISLTSESAVAISSDFS
jgi:hypothetical protein